MDDLREAIGAAAEARQDAAGQRAPEVQVPGTGRKIVAGLGAIAAALSLFLGWQGWSDPVTLDPQVLTNDAAAGVNLARIEVEDYRARNGSYPPDLAAVGMDGLGLTYQNEGSAFEIRAVDGWGADLGYRGIPGGQP